MVHLFAEECVGVIEHKASQKNCFKLQYLTNRIFRTNNAQSYIVSIVLEYDRFDTAIHI